MDPTWKKLLSPNDIALAESLSSKVDSLRKTSEIYPPQSQLFKAFSLTPPSLVKLVILGQDPYPTPGTANGLAFSTSGPTIPPSLRNIFKELHYDPNLLFRRPLQLGFPRRLSPKYHSLRRTWQA